jgi:predicted SAM-dependent methyltransferase
MKINPLTALAIPTWGNVSISWAQAYRHIAGPLGSNMVELQPVVGKPIGEARNELMAAAIENKCDFIFFLGDDVLPPSDTLIRMLQRMWDSPEIDMITGVYWTKQWPTQPYIWRGMQRGPYMDWKHGEFFEVDFAGCDCLMIRLTDKVKALGPDWFSTDWAWERDGSASLLPTEDFYFYTRARKEGLKLWCDTQIQCIHQDRGSGQQFGLTADMPQYGADKPELPDAKTDAAPLVKLADVGCGFEAPYFGAAEDVKIVRFDGNEKTKPDYRCDIRNLPVEDKSFDVVHSRHVLEHFGRADVMKVLKEWTRILRVGGEFRISVPNLSCAMKNILLMEEGILAPDPYPFWQLYGRQDDEYDIHKNGFTPKRLKLLLERLGIFEDIEVTTSGGEDGDLNVIGKAIKAKHGEKYALLPDWDAIEKSEDIEVAGVTRNGTEPSKNGHKKIAKKKSPIKEPVLKEKV